eukprot:GHVN01058834.1.p1 GENE.GHVN01058834.1~~GHVN01058834.1.p1  ORF type:complete len:591 (+),score=35.68 GHVN01058834.1:620-2392(+)
MARGYLWWVVLAVIISACGRWLLAVTDSPWDELERHWTDYQSAKVKINKIWSTMYNGPREPVQYPSYLEFLRTWLIWPYGYENFHKLSYQKTFRPFPNKLKALHTQGTYAVVKLNLNEDSANVYTGLFQESEQDAILAFSRSNRATNLTNFFGGAMKLFRTDGPDADILFAYSIPGIPNWNLFDYMLCGHIPWHTSLVFMPFSFRWTLFNGQFGLRHVANQTQAGQRVSDPNWPWELCFRPTIELKERFKGFHSMYNFINLLQYVEPNTKLYDVIAIREPFPLTNPERLHEDAHLIGEVISQSPFITSTYADQRLFMQHAPWEWDLELKPHWKEYSTANILMREGGPGAFMPLFPPAERDMDAHMANLDMTVNGLHQMMRHRDELREIIGVAPEQLIKELQLFYDRVEEQHGVKMPDLRSQADLMDTHSVLESLAGLPFPELLRPGALLSSTGSVQAISSEISEFFERVVGNPKLPLSLKKPVDLIAGRARLGSGREEPSTGTLNAGGAQAGEAALLDLIAELVQKTTSFKTVEGDCAGLECSVQQSIPFLKESTASLVQERLASSGLAREVIRDYAISFGESNDPSTSS